MKERKVWEMAFLLLHFISFVAKGVDHFIRRRKWGTSLYGKGTCAMR